MQERLKRMNERLLPWILSILPGVQHAHQDKAPLPPLKDSRGSPDLYIRTLL